MRNFSERRGTGKLRAQWENTIYVVAGKEDNLPVYNIKPENSKGTSTKKSIATSSFLVIFCHPHLKLTAAKIIKKISQDKSIQSDSNVTSDKCDSDSESEIIILQPQLYQNYNHPPTVPEINQSACFRF